jgi:hypothetical protein
VDLIHHLDMAGDTGRDERHRRDARRGDGEVSCGVGAGGPRVIDARIIQHCRSSCDDRKNRLMIYGAKDDLTYDVEFRASEDE